MAVRSFMELIQQWMKRQEALGGPPLEGTSGRLNQKGAVQKMQIARRDDSCEAGEPLVTNQQNRKEPRHEGASSFRRAIFVKNDPPTARRRRERSAGRIRETFREMKSTALAGCYERDRKVSRSLVSRVMDHTDTGHKIVEVHCVSKEGDENYPGEEGPGGRLVPEKTGHRHVRSEASPGHR
jgi:hypothetical protein